MKSIRWALPACVAVLELVACGGADTPAEPPHSIGGSVNGLTAAGLVLSNNGDTLEIASGSTSFTMPKPLERGTTYSLSRSGRNPLIVLAILSGAPCAAN